MNTTSPEMAISFLVSCIRSGEMLSEEDIGNIEKARLELKEMRSNLSFAQLRAANMKRLPLFKNKHGEPAHSEPDGSDWSDSDWLQAVVGELGGYAKIRKKLDRGDLSQEEAQVLMEHELADVICYVDLLAFRLGIDLGEAVRKKFNIVSDRVGVDVKL